MVPATKNWAELGFPGVSDVVSPPDSGAAAFARQTDEVQRTVLGPSAYAAYQAGEISLMDLVVLRHSPLWGLTAQRGSLLAARAANAMDSM